MKQRSGFVAIHRDLENQVRSMLKEYGLQFGRSTGSQFRWRAREMLADGHVLRPMIVALLTVHEQACRQQEKLDRQIRRLAREDETTRRLMTVPGVGIVAKFKPGRALQNHLKQYLEGSVMLVVQATSGTNGSSPFPQVLAREHRSG